MFLQTNQYKSTTVGEKLQSAFDRPEITGSIKNRGSHITIGDLLNYFHSILIFWVDGMLNTELLLTEIETRCVDIHRNYSGACDSGHFHKSEADGTGTNNQDGFTRLEVGSSDRVGADGQGFNEGELVGVQTWAFDQGGEGHLDELPETAIGMDTEDLNGGAAIGFMGSAGDAGAATKVREQGDQVAGLEHIGIGGRWGQFDDFGADFMAEDTGVLKKGLGTIEGVEIGAADTDLFHPEQGGWGAGGRSNWLQMILPVEEGSGLVANKGRVDHIVLICKLLRIWGRAI